MRWWLAAAVFWTLAIMAVCWLPLAMFTGGDGGEHPRLIPHFDKIVHAGIFAVFGILWLHVIPGKWRFPVVVLAGFLFLRVVTLTSRLTGTAWTLHRL